jgi:hypothetical protein
MGNFEGRNLQTDPHTEEFQEMRKIGSYSELFQVNFSPFKR